MNKVAIISFNDPTLVQIAEMEKSYFSAPWSLESLKVGIFSKEIYCFAIKENEDVIAYCTFQIIIDEVHIINVAVNHNFRNKLFGKKIMLMCMGYARQNKAVSMTLEVRSSNIAAQALYSGLGFENCGLRPKYYDNKEDAIIMWNMNIASTLNYNLKFIQKDENLSDFIKRID